MNVKPRQTKLTYICMFAVNIIVFFRCLHNLTLKYTHQTSVYNKVASRLLAFIRQIIFWLSPFSWTLIDWWNILNTCRHFCRGHWMTTKELAMIPSRAVWKFGWSRARMTFVTLKLISKPKDTTEYDVMSIWYSKRPSFHLKLLPSACA